MNEKGKLDCPSCGGVPAKTYDLPFGGLECESCGDRIWHLVVSSERFHFEFKEAKVVRQLLEDAIENHNLLGSIEMDSVDTVERVMEFEDALEGAS